MTPESPLSRYEKFYLYLGAMFLAALVTCNLIFQKFISTDLAFLGEHFLYPIGQWILGDSFDQKAFILSVGILPYPITFLVTDIVCELYGKKRADQLVRCGFVASLFALFIVTIADVVPAMSGSPVDDDTFSLVFSQANRAIFASMMAYLTAQFIDIRVFHFWKWLTKGRYLWIRNNGSTIFSQLVDSTLVIVLLFWNTDLHDAIPGMILSGFLFKVLCAFADTPLFYLAVWFLKPRLLQKTPAPVETTSS